LDEQVQLAPGGGEARIRGLEFGMLGHNHAKGYLSVSMFENRFVKGSDGIWRIREMRIFPLMKTDYTLGWGKSRIVDGPAAAPNAPDRAAPAGDMDAVPVFFLPNPATGKPVAYPKGTLLAGGAPLVAASGPSNAVADFDLAEARLRLGQSAAYDAIENLSSAFGNYIDDFQWSKLADLFAPDGARKVPSV